MPPHSVQRTTLYQVRGKASDQDQEKVQKRGGTPRFWALPALGLLFVRHDHTYSSRGRRRQLTVYRRLPIMCQDPHYSMYQHPMILYTITGGHS